MISKSIIFCGQRVTMACDGNCSKAWGIQARQSAPWSVYTAAVTPHPTPSQTPDPHANPTNPVAR
jgi:hypothetical protein